MGEWSVDKRTETGTKTKVIMTTKDGTKTKDNLLSRTRKQTFKHYFISYLPDSMQHPKSRTTFG